MAPHADSDSRDLHDVGRALEVVELDLAAVFPQDLAGALVIGGRPP